MLNGAPTPALVVGRTLSSYTVGGLVGNQETITYTVYNNQSGPETGVLLGTTLAPGVAFGSATVPTDQNGQALAWNLGTIPAFGRASVTVKVALSNPSSLQVDAGASATATSNGGPVSDSAPAATLRAGNLDPSLLSSTADANTTDPFVQEVAAQLDYDPQKIFDFLHTQIGYNSYTGSLRGARGTLWSGAGNALDVASLGVALMRASGIPSQYAQGTLPQNLTQQLIQSMFPDPLRVTDTVDPQHAIADPVHDPQLNSEAADHYWFEFDTGTGFRDADPLIAGAQIGQSFTSSIGHFAEVPDGLRQKVQVRLNAETYSSAAGLFGSGLGSQTVLDQTFNTVDLYGKTLTIGNLVGVTGGSALAFGVTTYTYTPYVQVDDLVGNPADDPVITGTPYQEVLTNFPLGSVTLTGLFLDVTTISSEDPSGDRQLQTDEKTLFDRIGYANRHSSTGVAISVDASSGPALNNFDLTTLAVTPGGLSTSAVAAASASLGSLASQLQASSPAPGSATASDEELAQAANLERLSLVRLSSILASGFLVGADQMLDDFTPRALVVAYAAAPRIVFLTTSYAPNDSDPSQTKVGLQFDVVKDVPRIIAFPGQASSVAGAVQALHGFQDGLVEAQTLSTLPGASAFQTTSANGTIEAATAAGIPFTVLTQAKLAELSSLPISDEARARIADSLAQGNEVIVPTRMVTVDGKSTIAWYEYNPQTGATTAVAENGSHASFADFSAAVSLVAARIRAAGAAVLGLVSAISFNLMFQISSLLYTGERTFEGLVESRLEIEKLIEQVLELLENPAVRDAAEEGLRDGADFWFKTFSSANGIDPPIGDHLVSPDLDARFANLGVGLPGVLATSIVPDPLYTVPVGGAQLPTAFLLGIKNTTTSTQVVTLDPSLVPSGFQVLTSVPRITIPAGATGEVGVYLVPTGQLPAPGTQATFAVTATSTTDPTVTATESETFTVPAVHAVTMSLSPGTVTTTPGIPAQAVLTLTNVGNVAEDVSLALTLPTGLTASPLTSVPLAVGQSTTVTLTLTPDASTVLNTTLLASLIATYGESGTPTTQTLQVPVNLAVPGASAIASAAVAADQLGYSGLAQRLDDLGHTLTDLVQDPSNDVFKSQSLASLDSVIGQLGADPALASLANDLTAARGVLAGAVTAIEIQTAVVALGNRLDSLGSTLTNLLAHRAELSLSPSTQVVQPQTPATFQLSLRNLGTETTTYDLSLPNLPSNVTGTLSQTTVTLAPGDFVTNLTVTLTSTSTTRLDPLSFSVQASVEGAPEIQATASGSLSARTEFVSIVSVSTDPPFVSPGGTVNVSARVLNAVNREQQALASYVLKDSGGQTVQTSQAVPVTLGVLTSLVTVNLGAIDTTGLTPGDYTIAVVLTDSAGQPIPGATGEGRLLVGSPVTSSLDVTPGIVPAGTSTVTNTLTIGSSVPLVGPLGVLSQTAVPGVGGVVKNGNLLYVGASDGIRVYDIADPSNPQLVRTVGTFADILKVHGDKLYALKFGGGNGAIVVSIYSLATPDDPQLLGATPGIPYANATDMVVTDTHVFVPIFSVYYFLGNNDVFEQTGDLLSIDVSDPTAPHLDGVLRNTYGTDTDANGAEFGINLTGGDGNLWSVVQVDPTTLLVSGSTTIHSDTQTGSGVVLVVDISDPTHMTVVKTLEIPGTLQAVGLAMEGNRVFVSGSTGSWNDFGQDLSFTGNIVLATLDVSDPRNPSVIATQAVNRSPRGRYNFATSLGGGRFAFSSLGSASDQPEITVVDASDPQHLGTSSTIVPAEVVQLGAGDGLIYTMSASGLILYQLDAPDAVPVTASVQIPRNTGVSVVPGSFSLPPSQVIPGADFDTYLWNLSLGSGAETQTITWQSIVSGMQPGESRPVTLGASVAFTSQGTPGQVTLPAQKVSAEQVLGLDPSSRTVAPGGEAGFTLLVSNPSAAEVTYALSIQGISTGWSSLPADVTVPAGGSLSVPFTITSAALAALGDYGFTIVASGSNGAAGSVQGLLTLQGQPVAVDPESHGVVVTLTPPQGTAGQGTSVRYVVRVTNTGSAGDTFALAVSGLPQGITASFERSTVDVSPGASNFRDVVLTLSPSPGTAASSYTFTVNATSTARASITSSALGSLSVMGNGVGVTLNPPSGGPGTGFQATVTNTGQATDTFDLTLGGPGALVASLGMTQVTLAPGASIVVPILTGPVNFALPGALGLSIVATSHGNTNVRAGATAALSIATTAGVTAQFSPASKTLDGPGQASFLLDVRNTGNAEDSYEAVIVGKNGPVTASLIGLDGLPTQTIPLFRLPALTSGALRLSLDLSAFGQGVVTVIVRSRTSGSIAATAQATLSAVTSTPIAKTVTHLSVAPKSVTVGHAVTLSATVQGAGGNSAPTGTVTFFERGKALGTVKLQAGGHATLSRTLAVGSYAIVAVYSGDATHSSSRSPVSVVKVVRATTPPPQHNPPMISSVLRYGYHMQPTVLVLHFTAPLDEARAEDLGNYSIVTQGGPGRGEARRGHTIGIESAVYDPVAMTVTLRPIERLDIHDTYRLLVRGTGVGGLKDLSGQPLAGQGKGHPGTDYTALITRRMLKGPASVASGEARGPRLSQSNALVAWPSASAVDALGTGGSLVSISRPGSIAVPTHSLVNIRPLLLGHSRTGRKPINP